MGSWADKTTYGGKRVNLGTRRLLEAANKILATSRWGGEDEPLTLLQGSYSGAVSASAGTHNGGAAFDTTPYNISNRGKVLRLLGVSYWERPAIYGLWSRHGHGIVCGDGTAAPAAARQVTEYYAGGDGLVGSRPDPNWRPLVFPMFVFPEKPAGKPGRRYATTAVNIRTQPTTRAPILGQLAKGKAFDVVAVVNVKGSYWAVDRNLHFVSATYLRA